MLPPEHAADQRDLVQQRGRFTVDVERRGLQLAQDAQAESGRPRATARQRDRGHHRRHGATRRGPRDGQRAVRRRGQPRVDPRAISRTTRQRRDGHQGGQEIGSGPVPARGPGTGRNADAPWTAQTAASIFSIVDSPPRASTTRRSLPCSGAPSSRPPLPRALNRSSRRPAPCKASRRWSGGTAACRSASAARRTRCAAHPARPGSCRRHRTKRRVGQLQRFAAGFDQRLLGLQLAAQRVALHQRVGDLAEGRLNRLLVLRHRDVASGDGAVERGPGCCPRRRSAG